MLKHKMLFAALVLLGFLRSSLADHAHTTVSCVADITSNQAEEMTVVEINSTGTLVSANLPASCCLECESEPTCWQWEFRAVTYLNQSGGMNQTINTATCTLYPESQGIAAFPNFFRDPATCIAPDPMCILSEARYSFKHDASGLCSAGQIHCGAGFCLNNQNVCDGVGQCRGHVGPLSRCNFSVPGLNPGDNDTLSECPIDELDCNCVEEIHDWNDGFQSSSDNVYAFLCTASCSFLHIWRVITQGTGLGATCNHTDFETVVPVVADPGVCSPGQGFCVAITAGPTAEFTGDTTADPHFHGFGGGLYDVQGEAGKVFAIISDAHVQINSLFLLQTEGFSADYHPEWAMSTYLGPMGLHLYDNFFILYPDCSAKIENVYFQRLTSGVLEKEFFSNGIQIAHLTQTPNEFRLTAPGFKLTFACTGHGGTAYFDLHATLFPHLIESPHGLLGQTADGVWRPTCDTCLQGEGAIDGLYTDYVVGEDEEGLMQTSFMFSRFEESMQGSADDKDALLFSRTHSHSLDKGVAGSGFGSAGKGERQVDPVVNKASLSLGADSSARLFQETVVTAQIHHSDCR